MMFPFIILALVGAFLVLLGWIIWKFKIARAIAGYDETKIIDPDGFARWNGKCLMGSGIVSWLFGAISLLFQSKNSETILFLLFMFLMMTTAAVTVAGSQRYHK
ncbi:DUF3784 domain-containing protein [Larkinella rosea]|uniref:DUF3784 domain-containing protein n=1 Tax=Larkinella rosea TaxID=2025312 RepID=A0A3P1BIP2_9BACT|nr:DUF3784 domain-containing protein [Larkinella rosea]RRB00766.1 DUF3784 domain-containing protein [Larkinella rosea]